MAKYNISNFKKGDEVYHLSNHSLRMVAIEINNDLNEVTCRWLDKNGVTQTIGFMAEELGKTRDLAPRIRAV